MAKVNSLLTKLRCEVLYYRSINIFLNFYPCPICTQLCPDLPLSRIVPPHYRASKGGHISKQGPVGRGSRPAAQLQPANEETLATLSKSSRPCRNRHSSKWSKTRVPHDPAAQEQQTSSSTSLTTPQNQSRSLPRSFWIGWKGI